MCGRSSRPSMCCVEKSCVAAPPAAKDTSIEKSCFQSQLRRRPPDVVSQLRRWPPDVVLQLHRRPDCCIAASLLSPVAWCCTTTTPPTRFVGRSTSDVASQLRRRQDLGSQYPCFVATSSPTCSTAYATFQLPAAGEMGACSSAPLPRSMGHSISYCRVPPPSVRSLISQHVSRKKWMEGGSGKTRTM